MRTHQCVFFAKKAPRLLPSPHFFPSPSQTPPSFLFFPSPSPSPPTPPPSPPPSPSPPSPSPPSPAPTSCSPSSTSAPPPSPSPPPSTSTGSSSPSTSAPPPSPSAPPSTSTGSSSPSPPSPPPSPSPPSPAPTSSTSAPPPSPSSRPPTSTVSSSPSPPPSPLPSPSPPPPFSIHGYAIRNCIEVNMQLGTKLIDMYASCGCLRSAAHVFDRMLTRNLVHWTAMICGLANYGHAEEAVMHFDALKEAGIKPNGIIFTSVLNACCHAGLVVKGQEYFLSMVEEHRLEPSIHHQLKKAQERRLSFHIKVLINPIWGGYYEEEEMLYGKGNCKSLGMENFICAIK